MADDKPSRSTVEMQEDTTWDKPKWPPWQIWVCAAALAIAPIALLGAIHDERTRKREARLEVLRLQEKQEKAAVELARKNLAPEDTITSLTAKVMVTRKEISALERGEDGFEAVLLKPVYAAVVVAIALAVCLLIGWKWAFVVTLIVALIAMAACVMATKFLLFVAVLFFVGLLFWGHKYFYPYSSDVTVR